jgi:hypothetical protein
MKGGSHQQRPSRIHVVYLPSKQKSFTANGRQTSKAGDASRYSRREYNKLLYIILVKKLCIVAYRHTHYIKKRRTQEQWHADTLAK